MKILKIIFCIAVLALMYLYALNGRYVLNSNGVVLDKWTGQTSVAGSRWDAKTQRLVNQ